MRDLPNYDEATDTLVPPGDHKNIFNPETGLIENPDALVKTRVLVADTIEGLAFGRDIFTIDDVVEKPEWLEGLIDAGGNLLSSTGILVLSSLVTSLYFTGINAGATSPGGKLLEKTASSVLKSGLRLGTYHKIKGLINPDATDEKTMKDSAMWSMSAGVGRAVTEHLLAKYAPLSPIVIDRLVTSASGVLFGQLGNVYNYESPEEFLQDYASVDTLIFIMADMVMFGYQARREGTPTNVALKFEKFNKMVLEYNRNPSEANQEELLRQINDLGQYLMDSQGVNILQETDKQYGVKLKAQYDAVKKIIGDGVNLGNALEPPREPQTWNVLGIVNDPNALEPLKEEEVKRKAGDAVEDAVKDLGAVKPEFEYDDISDLISEIERTPVDPPGTNRPEPQEERPLIEDIIESIATKGVSEEEALRLSTATPSDKTSIINTSRMEAPATAKKLVESLAGASSTFKPTTYESLSERATRAVENVTPQKLDALLAKVENLTLTLEEGAEIWTTVRAFNASTAEAYLDMIRKGGSVKDMSPQEKGKLLKLGDIHTALAKGHKDIGSLTGQTLSSGNIYVGGKQIDLSGIVDEVEETPTTVEPPEEVAQEPASPPPSPPKETSGDPFVDRYNEELTKHDGDTEKVDRVIEYHGQNLADSIVTSEVDRPPYKDPKRILQNVVDSLVELKKNSLVSPLSSKAFIVATQGIDTVWDLTSSLIGATYGSIGRAIKGDEFGDAPTYKETLARASGYYEGMIRSFTQPMTTFTQIAEMEGRKDAVDSLWDKVSLLVRDPKTFEEYYDKTSMTPYIGFFNTDSKAITSENWLGDIENKPVLEVMGTMIDYYGSIVRLQGFGTLETAGRYHETASYHAELNSLLTRDKNLTPETFAETKEKVLLYNTSKNLKLSFREHAEKTLGMSLSYKEKEFIDEEFYAWYADGIFEDPVERQRIARIDKQASEFSTKAVWKHGFENKTAETFANIFDVKGVQLVIPFVKTHMKMLGENFRRAGLNRQRWQDILGKTLTYDGKPDRYRQLKALSDMTLSLLLIVGAGTLLDKGRVSPRARTASERRNLRDSEIPENGLRLWDDKWVRADRLGPTGQALALSTNAIRDIRELFNPETRDSEAPTSELVGSLFQDVILILTSGSAMISARDLLDFSTGRSDPLKWMERQAGTFNILRGPETTLERYSMWGLNPFYTSYRTESLLSKRPILDNWGKPRPAHKHILGVEIQEHTDSPAKQEVLAVKAVLRQMPMHIGGVELSEDEHYALMRVFGEEVDAEKKMTQFVSSKYYKGLPSVNLQKDELETYWKKLQGDAQKLFSKDIEGYLARYVEKAIESRDEKLYGGSRESHIDAIFGTQSSSEDKQSGSGYQRRELEVGSPFD